MFAGSTRRVLPGFTLSLGTSLLFVCLILLLPLSALVMQLSEMSWSQYWEVVTNPQVVAAYKVTLLSAFVVCGGTFILCLLEPDLTFLQLLFEATSAFGTVGLSTGITPQLQPASKLIVILIMYTGRIGPLTVASLWAFRTEQHVWYSEETITIG